MASGRWDMPHNVECGPHSAHALECTRIVCAVEDRSDLLDLDQKFFFVAHQSFSHYYFLFLTVGVIVCRSDCWDVLVMSADGEAQATGTSSPTPQNASIDRGMVKDAHGGSWRRSRHFAPYPRLALALRDTVASTRVRPHRRPAVARLHRTGVSPI